MTTRSKHARWALHQYIFEQSVGENYPVVEHVFYGRTKAECEKYYQAHMKSDRFMRSCVQNNRFNSVNCWSEIEWEDLAA